MENSNNKIISDDLDAANTLDEYFQNVITKLGITECSDNFGTNAATLGDPVNIALEKFKDHPSVKIRRKQELSVTSQLKYLRYPLIFVIKCFKKYGLSKF